MKMKLNPNEAIYGAWLILPQDVPDNTQTRFYLSVSRGTSEVAVVNITQDEMNTGTSIGHLVKVDKDDYKVIDVMPTYDIATGVIVGEERHDFSIDYDKQRDTWVGDAKIVNTNLDGDLVSEVNVSIKGMRVEIPESEN